MPIPTTIDPAAAERTRRYHRLAGYVPLVYGLACMAVNLHSAGETADFGFAAGLIVALIGLAHLWQAERIRPATG